MTLINQCNLGDCLDVMRGMPENSVDSIVTDPPYGLTQNKRGGTGSASVNLENPYGRSRIGTGNGPGGFMGMKWDSDVPSVDIWAECLRVLKPGGYLLAFAGTRTQHRMAVRIEDAGFEIRDMIAWVYGSGFPKSHNGQWGGTALKPALEPITMARKPLAGTVEANWRTHGTGALNIEACRVDGKSTTRVKVGGRGTFPHEDDSWVPKVVTVGSDDGRWPANLIHDGSPEVLSCFPTTTSGTGAVKRASSADSHGNSGAAYGAESRPDGTPMVCYGDTGSAARFFYCAKASKEDRNDGCHGMQEMQYSHDGRETPIDNAYQRNSSNSSNSHPTVKPTDLMRYLCRLVTPIGGIILDPFMGSGSTGRGAVLEGFRFIGIEREAQYFEIAKARISSAERQGHQPNLFAEAA